MTLIALRVLISFNLKYEKRNVSIIYSGLKVGFMQICTYTNKTLILQK